MTDSSLSYSKSDFLVHVLFTWLYTV